MRRLLFTKSSAAKTVCEEPSGRPSPIHVLWTIFWNGTNPSREAVRQLAWNSAVKMYRRDQNIFEIELWFKALVNHIYRPQTKSAKVMFLQVSVCPQGACMVAGGVRGCQRACVVAGGMHGCRGVCMVAGGHAWLPGVGGMCGCWGVHGCQGACVVAGRRHAWLLGGVHGWGACVVAGGDMHG